MSKIEALCQTLQSGSLFVQKDGVLQPVPGISKDDAILICNAVRDVGHVRPAYSGAFYKLADEWSTDNREGK